jgi:hypothetical protein
MRLFAYILSVSVLLVIAGSAPSARAGVIDKLKKAAKKAGKAVKKVAKDAKEKVVKGTKKAVDKVKDLAKKAGAGIKKAFQKAKVGVVNLAKKIKAKASEVLKFIITGGNKLFYEYAPLKYARIHKELLSPKSTSTAGLVGSGAGSSSLGTAGGTSAVGFATIGGNPELPDAIKKFAKWYDYEAGDLQPQQSANRRDKQSLVADQGSRGTCVAFATTAALEAMAEKALLSKEYTYWLMKGKDDSEVCKSEGLTMSGAADKIANTGIPREVHYVYLPWQGFDGAKLCPAGPTGLAKHLATFKATSVYKLPWRASGKGAALNNPRFIEAAIDAGHEIVGSFDVALMKEKAGYFNDVIVDSDTKAATKAPGGHAMLVVGYDRTGNDEHGGGHIIVKNSWGALWGDGGYTKLTYDYVRQYAGDAFILGGFTK